jgi:hypothetical protein
VHTRISAKRGFAISRRGFFSVICSTDSTVDLISRLCWPPRQARSRLGISITGRRMSAFDKEPLTLSTSVRVSKLAINGNLLGPPGFDLDQRAYVLAADAQQLTSTARDEVSRVISVTAHEMTSLVNLIVYSSSAERPCFAKANCASDVSRASASAPNVRVAGENMLGLVVGIQPFRAKIPLVAGY